jgi:hypothetical protein
LSQKSAVRKIILSEIENDVIGPRNGSDESIKEYPSTAYLSGVLFPKETDVETDSEGEIKSESEDESSPNMGMKPSSMGVTCRVEAKTKIILAKIQYGKYSPKAKDENYGMEYQREHFEFRKDLDLSNNDPKPIELGEEGINLRYKIRKNSENQIILSVFIVNSCKPQKNRLGVLKRSIFQPKITLSATNETDYVFVDDESSFNKTDPSDPDALLLTLLFNSKKNFGTGHSCVVNWDDNQIKENKINLIQTTFAPVQSIKKITHVDLPEISGLDMTELSKVDDFLKYKEKLMPIITSYENWILQLESQLDSLPEDLKATAREQIVQCRHASKRIQRGIDIVSKNENHAGESFRFTNMAMALQQKYGNWAKSNREVGKVEGVSPPEFFGRWRLFQIAFILLNIESIVYPTESDRKEHEIADLLWFPTGGGKTEAYLGIIAFTMSLRRLRGYNSENQEHSVKSYGVSVIMRYTLRLLTVQQFQRASLLMCACEYIRRNETIPNSEILKWGNEPFYVGIWVGGSTTPNTISDAQDVLDQYKKTGTRPTKKNPCQLNNCPWCGAKITQKNYDLAGPIPQFRAYCSRDACLFSKKKCTDDDDYDLSLPVLLIDDDVYCRCPSLLISTIDKFAQITWKEKTGNLFGKADVYCLKCGFTQSKGHPKHQEYDSIILNESTKADPPELIVQDELHLISGPLGTLTGLYETAIDLLCMRNIDGMQVGPKIIASTATTKSATNQIHKLFDRSETRIFPPQGFSFGDSFFSKEDPDENAGKLYVGICSTGKSGLTILAKISAAILRKTRSLQEKNTYNPDDLDPYYTLVSYFNSTREMGGAFKMFQDSVPGFMQRIYNNFEVEDTAQTKIIQKKSDEITNDDLIQSFETKDTQIASKRKFVNNLLPPEELTSRVESSEIPDILNKLEIGLSKGTPVDTLLSTNMLSVGVDLPRLGVMIINGQPKNHSEYIQASGRIGRESPGLIITSYNYLKPRDLSHYENFKFYHSTFYKHVESVSLTPFSARSRDHGLFGVVVALVRLLIPILGENNNAQDFDPEHVNIKPTLSLIRNFIENRVNSVDAQETENALKDFDNVVREWDQIRTNKRPLKYKSNFHKLADKTAKQSDYYLLKTIENPEIGEKFAPMSLRDAEKNEALWYVEEQ